MNKETKKEERPRGEKRKRKQYEGGPPPPIAYPPPSHGPPPHYPGYPPPAYYPGYYPAVKTHSMAIVSMILGIISIAGIAICAAIGVVLGIIAIVLGIKAKKDIEMDPYMYTGMGFAKAGIITGIIGIVICTLYFIAIVMFYVFMILMMGV
jgi:hypothetical protein